MTPLDVTHADSTENVATLRRHFEALHTDVDRWEPRPYVCSCKRVDGRPPRSADYDPGCPIHGTGAAA